MIRRRHPLRWSLPLTMAALLSSGAWCSGQGILLKDDYLWHKPLIDVAGCPEVKADVDGPRARRLRLFGMPNDLGIISDDDQAAPDISAEKRPAGDEDDFPALQVNLGTYHPGLDLRMPGSPRQLGFYKMFSEMPIFDMGPTVL